MNPNHDEVTTMQEYELRDRLRALESELPRARRALGRRVLLGQDADAERAALARIERERVDVECALLALPELAAERRAATGNAVADLPRERERLACFEQALARFEREYDRADGPARIELGAAAYVAARATRSQMCINRCNDALRSRRVDLNQVKRRVEVLAA